MAISQNFPNSRPSLNLNFARSKTLDPRITFSRTTTATYVDDNGLVVTAAADEPRFDHHPTTGESLGLLVEEQRVNYEKNTEDPSQWTIANMVPTGNSVTLPTGVASTSIEYKGETTDANNKLIRPRPTGSTITAGDTWTYSGFYKKGVTNGERYIYIVLQNNTASEGTGRLFDFDTGTWQSTQGLNNVTDVDSGYEEYPNGWYRIWMSCTFPSASSVQTFTRLWGNTTSVPYDTSFSLWGAQLEKGSFPTSYIPNDTESQKTRNHDKAYYENVHQTDWFSKTEGTVIFEHTDVPYASSEDYDFPAVGFGRTNDGVGYTGIRYYITKRDGNAQYLVRLEGTDIANINVIGTGNDGGKVGFVYKEDDYALVKDGSLVGIDTSGVVPDAYMLLFGMNNVGSGGTALNFNAHIKNFQYYPTRLSNSILENLTK